MLALAGISVRLVLTSICHLLSEVSVLLIHITDDNELLRLHTFAKLALVRELVGQRLVEELLISCDNLTVSRSVGLIILDSCRRVGLIRELSCLSSREMVMLELASAS